MDDTRPLDGLTGDTGGYRQIQRSDRAENDLEDQGGLAYQRLRKPTKEEEDENKPPRRPTQPERYVSEDPTPPLVQTLDRMRTTGESGGGTDRLRKLRGQKHYRDDPTTAFHRRLGQAEQLAREARAERRAAAADDPGDALERRRDDDAPPSDALERKVD